MDLEQEVAARTIDLEPLDLRLDLALVALQRQAVSHHFGVAGEREHLAGGQRVPVARWRPNRRRMPRAASRPRLSIARGAGCRRVGVPQQHPLVRRLIRPSAGTEVEQLHQIEIRSAHGWNVCRPDRNVTRAAPEGVNPVTPGWNYGADLEQMGCRQRKPGAPAAAAPIGEIAPEPGSPRANEPSRGRSPRHRIVGERRRHRRSRESCRGRGRVSARLASQRVDG